MTEKVIAGKASTLRSGYSDRKMDVNYPDEESSSQRKGRGFYMEWWRNGRRYYLKGCV